MPPGTGGAAGITCGAQVEPADQGFAFEDGEDVVAVAALRFGHEDFDPVAEAEEPFGAGAVAQGGVEGREQADPAGGGREGGGLVRRAGADEGGAGAAVGEGDGEGDKPACGGFGGAPGAGLGRGGERPEGRNLVRRGETEAVERGRTGPVDAVLRIGPGGQMGSGDHAFGQVIDLAEAVTPGDGDAAGAPEVFERGLGGMPVPPAGRAAAFAGGKVGGRAGAVAGDAVKHAVEAVFEGGALPGAPARGEAGGIAGKAEPPVGEELHRDDGSVVGPMFEDGAVAGLQRGEHGRPVGGAARPEDQVMGAGEGVDAVDLDETERGNGAGDIGGAAAARGRGQKAVPCEEEPAGVQVGEGGKGHGRGGLRIASAWRMRTWRTTSTRMAV